MSTLLTGGHPSSLAVNWERCQGGVWCILVTLNLDHAHFNGLEGVYMIWRTSDRKVGEYIALRARDGGPMTWT